MMALHTCQTDGKFKSWGTPRVGGGAEQMNVLSLPVEDPVGSATVVKNLALSRVYVCVL